MLRLTGVSKTYRTGAFGRGTTHAVRNVSFELRPGEVTSLIGESGSGKSTIGRMVLRLTRPTAGTITFGDTDVGRLSGAGLKEYYRHVQGVFQDPFSTFNPIFRADRVFAMIRQSYFPSARDEEWRERVAEVVASVNLNPDLVLGKYPHQLSGGQLQRLLVARALLLDLRLLVADEIISMLDASTRIDVLNLLADLKERGLAVLFVTHDLSLGNYLSDQTVILRRGAVVERGDTEKVFGDPRHPYTRTLLASVPRLGTRWDDLPVPEADSHECDAPPEEVEDGHFVACFGTDSVHHGRKSESV
ncbi:ATP-binding cassette domain-containing protein [Actinophytocola glycyrrhizae]|uniref:ATP-binding cassette domain-containing protein n=1 Tax=Actinophytocola glycyrrhizae TaxID=2044873 RepID=A0ABV9RU12_9PSEU